MRGTLSLTAPRVLLSLLNSFPPLFSSNVYRQLEKNNLLKIGYAKFVQIGAHSLDKLRQLEWHIGIYCYLLNLFVAVYDNSLQNP